MHRLACLNTDVASSILGTNGNNVFNRWPIHIKFTTGNNAEVTVNIHTGQGGQGGTLCIILLYK